MTSQSVSSIYTGYAIDLGLCCGKQTPRKKVLRFSRGITVARVAREPLGYRMQSVQTDEFARSALTAAAAAAAYSGAARGRGEASPPWVDVQKLCNMCVLSFSFCLQCFDAVGLAAGRASGL